MKMIQTQCHKTGTVQDIMLYSSAIENAVTALLAEVHVEDCKVLLTTKEENNTFTVQVKELFTGTDKVILDFLKGQVQKDFHVGKELGELITYVRNTVAYHIELNRRCNNNMLLVNSLVYESLEQANWPLIVNELINYFEKG